MTDFHALSSYCHANGAYHLLKANRLEDAIRFLRSIQEDAGRVGGQSPGPEFSRSLSMLCNRLDERNTASDQQDVTDTQKVEPSIFDCLWHLYGGTYATDDLEVVAGWISDRAGDDVWWQQIGMMLVQDNYVVRYAAAAGQKRRFMRLLNSSTEFSTTTAQCEIFGLLSSQEEAKRLRGSEQYSRDEFGSCSLPLGLCGQTNSQEMGCYAVVELGKMIENDDPIPEWFEMVWLERMLEIPHYFARSALNDLLFTWSLSSPKRVAAFMAEHPTVREVSWEHLQLDLDVIDARLSAAQANDFRAVKKERRFLQAAKNCRSELLSELSGLDAISKVVATFLESDISLEGSELLTDMEKLFDQSSDTKPDVVLNLMTFLMSHPLWSKAEKTGRILGHLATRSHCSARVFETVDKLAEHDNWRVQYGAIEASFLFRHEWRGMADAGTTRFDLNLSRFHAHDVSRIRGLCAEDFVGDLFCRNARTWTQRLNGNLIGNLSCRDVISRWLCDDDCWVIDHIHRLFYMIFGKNSGLTERVPLGDKHLTNELKAWGNDQLDKLPTDCLLHRIPKWHLTSRDEFLGKLEHAKRDALLQGAPK